MFRRGLKHPLAMAIVERTHPQPQTLHRWYQAARAHHAAYAENKATATVGRARPYTRIHLAILRICDTRALDATDRGGP
jgi:hypothetical protein